MSISATNFVAAACAARISSYTLKNDHHIIHRALRATHLSVYRKLQSIHHTMCKSHDHRHHNAVIDNTMADHTTIRWVAAFITAVCLHLGSAQASDAIDLSSASEDQLLGIVRTIETRLDSTITSLRTILPSSPQDPSATAQQRESAISLIKEVFEVVDRNFDDSRNAGFSSDQWINLRNDILKRPLRSMEEAHSAIREMLSRLHDPYSRFLPPSEFSAMVKYDVSGVGVNLGTIDELESKTGLIPQYNNSDSNSGDSSSNNSSSVVASTSSSSSSENRNNIVQQQQQQQQQQGVWVVGIIRGSLAENAGIKQGDQLLMADGLSLLDKSPFQVASLLQGNDTSDNNTNTNSNSNTNNNNDNDDDSNNNNSKAITKKSSVELVIKHLDGTEETVQLQRPEKVKTPSPVSYKLEENGRVGYIKLSSFNARAQKDVSKAIKELDSRGVERYILDLRGNRGGLVTEGIEVARLFLSDNDLIVQTRGKARSSSTPITAPGPPLTSAPLAVLVDSHTASASEILSGALQDNCRAVLVGQNTYGKGLIQSVYELGDGSGMVLTVGKYVTPSGTDIDMNGLKPDFWLMPSEQAAEDAIQTCRVVKMAKQ